VKLNKFGYSNSEKKKNSIAPQFDNARDFDAFAAPVNKGGEYIPEEERTEGGKWGFILPTGEVWIDFQLDSVESFSEGRAFVSKDGEEFYIDVYGNRIVE